MNKYDIIGDVHGHADELEQLLQKMGYKRKNGVYSHPEERQVIFVGDYIDRGPKIRETLHLVRDMVNTGHAQAVMGNHEYNAVCFHTPQTQVGEGFFRKHTTKVKEQHIETLKQFKNYPNEWDEFLEWFRKMPLFLNLPECRVVHAYWNDKHVNWLENNYNGLTSDFLSICTNKDTDQYNIIEETLKGVEGKIPNGLSFFDKDGNRREECRLRWWEVTDRKKYGDVFLECPEEIAQVNLNDDFKLDDYQGDIKVFFGHYWLKGNPKTINNRCVCLDYSVAKGGKLVAARLNGDAFEYIY
jgi:hypothetical protein